MTMEYYLLPEKPLCAVRLKSGLMFLILSPSSNFSGESFPELLQIAHFEEISWFCSALLKRLFSSCRSPYEHWSHVYALHH